MDDLRFNTTYDPYSEGVPKKKGEFDDLSSIEGDKSLNLPFRFTEFAINPMASAASGQTERSAVARSPSTSGGLASELGSLRSKLDAMGNVVNPGEAPNPEDFNSGTAQDQGQEQEFAYGLPTMSYQLPESTVLNGTNPLFAAQMFSARNKGKDPEALEQEYGPMKDFQGYDMRSILGDEEYNTYFGKDANFQGSENEATQRFLMNMSMLPTSVNPFTNTNFQKQLATRDIAYAPLEQGYIVGNGLSNSDLRGAMIEGSPINYQSMGPEQSVERTTYMGGDVGDVTNTTLEPSYIDNTFDLSFDPNAGGTARDWDENSFRSSLEKDLNTEIHNSTKLARYGRKAAEAGAYGIVGAATGAGIGAGVGAVMGAGAGATAGTAGATGIAGALSVPAGVGASTVNVVGSMIASYGAAKAAEMLGLPMDSPIMSLAMGAAAGFGYGYGGGATPATDSGSLTSEHINTAKQLGLSEADYASQILKSKSIGDYVQTQVQAGQNLGQQGILSNTSNFGTSTVSPEQFSQGAGGIGSTLDNLTPEQKQNLIKYGVKGLEGYAAEQNPSSLNGGSSGGGQGLSPEDQILYDNAVKDYNVQLESFNKFSEMQKQWEELMGKYSSQQKLMSQEKGLLSDIMGTISGNPYYTPNMDYTSPQSQFV